MSCVVHFASGSAGRHESIYARIIGFCEGSASSIGMGKMVSDVLQDTHSGRGGLDQAIAGVMLSPSPCPIRILDGVGHTSFLSPPL